MSRRQSGVCLSVPLAPGPLGCSLSPAGSQATSLCPFRNSQLLLDGRWQLGLVSGKRSLGDQTMGCRQLRTVLRWKPQQGKSGTSRASRGKGGKGRSFWKACSRENVAFHVNGAPWRRAAGGPDLTQRWPEPSPAPSPGLPSESGLMRVHASEAGTTPSSWPHRKLPEDNSQAGATGTQTFWTRNSGWPFTLRNFHNRELIQAEGSTLHLEAEDAHPPPHSVQTLGQEL